MTHNSNAPRIISNGGGHEAHVSINENKRFVTDVQTYDTVSSEANRRLSYSIIGGADAHLFQINKHNGQLFFKNAPDYENPRDHGRNNVYDVKVKVKDGGGYTDTQRLFVKVKNVAENSRPSLIPGEGSEFHVNEGNDFVANINANDDRNSEGNGLTYSIAGGIDSGAFEIDNQTGELFFKQAPDFEAPTDADGDNQYHVKVKVTDANGASDTDSYRINVKDLAENAAPNAQNDDAFTNESEAVTINVLGNDSDPDGDTLIVTSLNGQTIEPGQTITTANGSVTLQNDEQLVFVPNDGFIGTETFSYHTEDPSGAEDTATVSVVVNPDPNQVPDAIDDSATVAPGEKVSINVLGNDTDPDGDDLSITQIMGNGPVNGTAEIVNGRIHYTANSDFEGNDTFAYQISDGNGGTDVAQVVINVEQGNRAPLAEDDSASTIEGETVVIDVLNNDSDPDGDAISVSSLEQAANGTVSLNNDGTVTYTPDAGFVGTDVFNYHITDGNGTVSDAQVFVTVDAADPVDPQTAAIGNRVFLDANQNGIQDAGEAGVDGVHVTLAGAGADGTFGTGDDVILRQDTSNGGFYGFGNLAAGEYKVGFSKLPDGLGFTDANIGINENIDSDADPNTGVTEVINLAAGQVNNSVDAGLVEQFTNSAPQAQDDNASTVEGQTIDINVLANDSDPDGDAISVSSLEQAANGSVTLNDDGSIAYTPNDGFVGTDVFNYHITDGNGTVSDAQVFVTVDAADPVDPKTGFVGNRVFSDDNGNGIHDNGEEGFGGVRVTLTGAGQDGVIGTNDDVTVGSQVVGDSGYYGFGNLAAGDYKVTFSEIAPGFGLTDANVGGNEAADSDADPISGMTDVITLAPAEFNAAVDAGIVELINGGKNDIVGTEQADWPLKGTDQDDSIFGLGGNDELKGFGGNDHLTGGTGNDRLLGGAGNDTLLGTDNTALGFHEVDNLAGGAGADRFILANNDTSYYFGDEWGGFAIINDFTAGEDVVVLHGPADQYALEVDTVRGSTNLYCLSDGADKNRDAIAIFQNNTNLDLSSSSFEFIG